MKIKTMGTIVGCHHGFEFEVPKGTVCDVEDIKGDVVYFYWEDETATAYKRYVEFQ